VFSVTFRPFFLPGITSIPVEMEAVGPYGWSALFFGGGGGGKSPPPPGFGTRARPPPNLVTLKTGPRKYWKGGRLGLWVGLAFFWGGGGDERPPPTRIRTPVRPATNLVALHTGAREYSERRCRWDGNIKTDLRTIGCAVTQRHKIRAIK